MLKVIVLGGDYSSDYVIKMFTKNSVPPIVVNEDKEIAKYLSKRNNISVYCSPINKLFTYDNLNITDYDLVIALDRDDIKNYIAISLLKTYFNVKKAICVVSNPDNVESFKRLGIDSAIAGSQILAQHILNDSGIEALVKSISIESDKIFITEITLKSVYLVVGKALKNIKFPCAANVACIFRNDEVIVPNGETVLLTGDKLVVCSSRENQKTIIKFIKKD